MRRIPSHTVCGAVQGLPCSSSHLSTSAWCPPIQAYERMKSSSHMERRAPAPTASYPAAHPEWHVHKRCIHPTGIRAPAPTSAPPAARSQQRVSRGSRVVLPRPPQHLQMPAQSGAFTCLCAPRPRPQQRLQAPTLNGVVHTFCGSCQHSLRVCRPVVVSSFHRLNSSSVVLSGFHPTSQRIDGGRMPATARFQTLAATSGFCMCAAAAAGLVIKSVPTYCLTGSDIMAAITMY